MYRKLFVDFSGILFGPKLVWNRIYGSSNTRVNLWVLKYWRDILATPDVAAIQRPT